MDTVDKNLRNMAPGLIRLLMLGQIEVTATNEEDREEADKVAKIVNALIPAIVNSFSDADLLRFWNEVLDTQHYEEH